MLKGIRKWGCMSMLITSKNWYSSRERSVQKVMRDINMELSEAHKSVVKKIDVETYIHATEFAQQYISYTSIWNMKFSYNLESPEVAITQLLHLEYILEHEDASLFSKEHAIFEEMKKLFNLYKPYTDDMIEQRKRKMQLYIEGKI